MRLTTLTIIGLGLISIIGCESQICAVNYPQFSRQHAPLIYIVEQKGNCVYLFEGQFWFGETQIISGGDMIFDDDAVFLKIDLVHSSEVKYFDFSKRVGERYEISFDPSNSDLTYSKTFSAEIEKVVQSVNGIDVFIFRIRDAFLPGGDYGDYVADIVFFLTRENGIIGSYISKIEGDAEFVIHRKGDILEDVLDYSKKEFRNIE